MIYGLYLSATGVLTNSYRQDVIANNLANSETVGFKRHVASFQQRLTEAQEQGLGSTASNPLLEKLGGGTFAAPTMVDGRQGELETTGTPLDMAIDGRGYFAVQDQGQIRLTRDGQFSVDRGGNLVLANGRGQKVLDVNRKPIQLDPRMKPAIGRDGQVTLDGAVVAQLGVFDVPNPKALTQQGGTLLAYPEIKKIQPVKNPTLVAGHVERSNVDPLTELASLIETQRQLEANANMIRTQDQTLARLVTDVGRIS